MEAIKPLKLVSQAAEFKFGPKFEPLPVIWQSLRMLFQKEIEGLEGKINGQALGATQGVSESVAATTSSLEENMQPLLLY